MVHSSVSHSDGLGCISCCVLVCVVEVALRFLGVLCIAV